LLIVAAVLDVAVMTTILHHGLARPGQAVYAAADFVLRHLPPLARFALALLVRILLLAAPFLAVAAVIAAIFLREFDINYYLTNRPPEFTTAALLIGVLAAVFAGLLLHRLSGWAIALHLTLFEGVRVRNAFVESRERMVGARFDLIRQLLGWLVVRVGIVFLVAFVAGLIVGNVPGLLGSNLRLITATLIVVGILWSIANTIVNAISNGVLSDILNDAFERAQIGRTSYEDHTPPPSARLLSPAGITIAIVGLVSLTSLGAGGLLLEQVRSDAAVEVIGHRGAAALRPENTMAAIIKAIEDGADWVEIDVQESAEGEIIVAHDSDFMKAAGVPTKVWDVTAADLETIDIGSWFDAEYSDERVPHLRDVLAAAKDNSNVIIELKYYGHDEDLEARVIALVEEAGMAEQVATMSLKYPAVQKMLSLRPTWRTGVLAATAVGDLTGLEGDFLAVNTGQVSTRLVQRADAAGKDVYAWTVNDPVTMMRMIALGVDGLITDDPALARDVIAYRNTLSTPERFLLAVSDRVGVVFDLDKAEELRP
jgi:glycerophosphoryl diester phosphodiesterase